MAAIPPLNVFLMVPFLCRERWLPPSKPPRHRHRGGREILGVNMAFTTPLRKRREKPSIRRDSETCLKHLSARQTDGTDGVIREDFPTALQLMNYKIHFYILISSIGEY